MNTEVITSAANAQLKALRALEQKKERTATGLFVLEGERNIQDAVSAGWQIETLVTAEGHYAPKELEGEAGRHLVITADLMSRLAGRENAQPVWAALRQRWAGLDAAAQGLWVALEDVHDPGNLGTIIRSCAATGAAGVLLIGNCCDPYAPEAIRASVGTFAHVAVAKCSVAEFASWRTGYKGQVIATHLAGSVDWREPKYDKPLILLMGSESDGLTDELAALADVKVRIPMSAQAESLNLGIATALMLYRAAGLT